MSDSDFEIEYLDEDAELVQHCMSTENDDNLQSSVRISPLLVEREVKMTKKRTKRVVKPRSRVFEPIKDKQFKHRSQKKVYRSKVMNINKTKQIAVVPRVQNDVNKILDISNLSNEDAMSIPEEPICIPDFMNSPILPVVLTSKDSLNIDKLKTWNKQCTEVYKNRDKGLIYKPTSNDVKCQSKQVTVLQNHVTNNSTEEVDTTVWTKILSENSLGECNSETFQGTMPMFKEQQQLDFKMYEPTKKSCAKTVSTVILTNEKYKNMDVLKVYRPEKAISSIYKLIERSEMDTDVSKPERYLEEQAHGKVCAPCFQFSCEKDEDIKMDEFKCISCTICKRVYMNAKSLLSHLLTHNDVDIQKHKDQIVASLVEKVGYSCLYKCRICQESYVTAKDLKRHLETHRGKTAFKCFLGNHMSR